MTSPYAHMARLFINEVRATGLPVLSAVLADNDRMKAKLDRGQTVLILSEDLSLMDVRLVIMRGKKKHRTSARELQRAGVSVAEFVAEFEKAAGLTKEEG